MTADKGYDALHVYRIIVEDFGAKPIIPIRSMRPGAKKRRKNSGLRTNIDRKSTEFKRLLAGRTSVERASGLLKSTRRLERHQMRTLYKLTAHCLMSVAIMQARALAQALDEKPIREGVRRVA
ncbi:MAG: transposase [Chloroflexi bacterium]|nr:transposase [Chloroflexota bacterium]